jgi:predicted  nucleic acid-binding Zn-ribbon protein
LWQVMEALRRGDIGDAEVRNVALEDEIEDLRDELAQLRGENRVLRRIIAEGQRG